MKLAIMDMADVGCNVGAGVNADGAAAVVGVAKGVAAGVGVNAAAAVDVGIPAVTGLRMDWFSPRLFRGEMLMDTMLSTLQLLCARWSYSFR
jgi:hypothetical protein